MIILVVKHIRNTDQDMEADLKNVGMFILRIVKTEMGCKGFQQAIIAMSGPSSCNEMSTAHKE